MYGSRSALARPPMRPLRQRLAHADAVMRRVRAKLKGETTGGSGTSGDHMAKVSAW